MPTREHTVPAQARGTRLDVFLAGVEPALSRSRLRALIDQGAVTVAGRSPKPALLLRGGERVTLAVPEPVPAAPLPQAIPLRVLFEDAALVVVDKPAGMVVHPGAGNRSGTLVNALLSHCRDLAGVGGELRPGIVHRLDKETSGCIVVAKDDRSLASLQAQFKSRRVAKEYLALVHGVPAAAGRFETLHGRHPRDRKRFTARVRSGRSAVTEWRVERAFAGAALVRVRLLTGRTHQIRVHFSEAGHPLLGDSLYGGVRREARLDRRSAVRRAAQALGRQALHAASVEFDHPRTGKRTGVAAPLPPDLVAALAILEDA